MARMPGGDNTEKSDIDTTKVNFDIQYVGQMINDDTIYRRKMDSLEAFENLKQSYVIFICTFDLFEEGKHRYTFENRCKENHELLLKDGTTKIFLNTEGTENDISGDLKAFLDYVGGRESDNDFVKKLEEEVKMAKQNREWRREYMTLMMRDRENIEKGIKQGLEQGIAKRDRMLIVKWSADGRTVSEIANLLDIPEEQVRRIQLDQ